jgi:2-aminoadipate transaminase
MNALAKPENLAPPWKFSDRAEKITSSVIREILKITERPEVISFAGGLPSPAAFPIEVMRAAFDKVLAENGKAALQYGATEGIAPLREWVAANLRREGAEVTAENILLVSGSQQALDLLGKVLINPRQRVLVETPTYLGALQAFNLFEPHYVSVPSDEDGLQPQALTQALCGDAAFLYALPNFQNPTGRTLTGARREALVPTVNCATVVWHNHHCCHSRPRPRAPVLFASARSRKRSHPDCASATLPRLRRSSVNWCRQNRPPIYTPRR